MGGVNDILTADMVIPFRLYNSWRTRALKDIEQPTRRYKRFSRVKMGVCLRDTGAERLSAYVAIVDGYHYPVKH